jgi:hypothetical protein
MDVSSVTPAETVALVWPAPVTFEGAPGSTSNADLVRVTNLDSTEPVTVTSVRPDGSFTIAVPVASGNELRFQAVSDQARGEPIDVLYLDTGTLTPVQRPDCVELDPGYELAFAGPSSKPLGIHNTCTDAVVVSAPTTRLGLPDFSVSIVAATLASGDTLSATVTFAPAGAGEREDVLFLPIDVAAQTVRYPVTLFGPTAP